GSLMTCPPSSPGLEAPTPRVMIGGGYRPGKPAQSPRLPGSPWACVARPRTLPSLDAARGGLEPRSEEESSPVSVFERCLWRLPVRALPPRDDGQPLGAAALGRI